MGARERERQMQRVERRQKRTKTPVSERGNVVGVPRSQVSNYLTTTAANTNTDPLPDNTLT